MKNQATLSPTSHYKSGGFTLIELMIVVAIIGIIAAIGYPSYTQYVQKSRRADGQLALMNSVQSMERCKTTRFTYSNCTITGTQATSPEGYYSIALGDGLTASTFSIVATAQDSQVNDTGCETLTINELGERTPTECW